MADTTQNMMGDSTEAERYLDTFRRSEYVEPEKALIAAILEDAIHQYHKYRHAGMPQAKNNFAKPKNGSCARVMGGFLLSLTYVSF